MGYLRIDKELTENGVAVDMMSDGTLFVKVRASRAKAVEAERQKQQAPYRNLILSGRPLPAHTAREMGQRITANAIVVGVAGTLPSGKSFGKIADGKPVEFAAVPADELIAEFNDFPDFEEDVSTAASTNATFAVAEREPGESATKALEEPITAHAAAEEAAKN